GKLRASLSVAQAEERLDEKAVRPARRRVVEQSILQYIAMQISVFRLLAANREELRAKLAHINAVASYWTAQAAFDALFAGHLVRADGMMAMPAMNEAQTEGE